MAVGSRGGGTKVGLTAVGAKGTGAKGGARRGTNGAGPEAQGADAAGAEEGAGPRKEGDAASAADSFGLFAAVSAGASYPECESRKSNGREQKECGRGRQLRPTITYGASDWSVPP